MFRKKFKRHIFSKSWRNNKSGTQFFNVQRGKNIGHCSKGLKYNEGLRKTLRIKLKHNSFKKDNLSWPILLFMWKGA